MIAVDTNILVHAHREDSPFHAAALDQVRALAEGTASWAIPAPCLHEFLAIATAPRIYAPPSPVAVAIDFVESLLESPTVTVLAETEGYWPTLSELVRDGNVSGARVHDARIAAICLHHRVSELWTADRDFSRFPRLKTRNPLIPA